MATRQSISLAEPNDQFLSALVNSGEYSSKSEAVNDLIRQARRKQESRINAIRASLIEAEKSIEKQGYSDKSPEQRLADFKNKARQHGRL